MSITKEPHEVLGSTIRELCLGERDFQTLQHTLQKDLKKLEEGAFPSFLEDEFNEFMDQLEEWDRCDTIEQEGEGLHLDTSQRYEETIDDLLLIYKRLLSNRDSPTQDHPEFDRFESYFSTTHKETSPTQSEQTPDMGWARTWRSWMERHDSK